MVRLKAATFFYALGLLLIPFSFAVKNMLLMVNIPWVDPTLVLGLMVFVLIKAPMRDKRALWIVSWAFLSAFIGSFFLEVSAHTLDRPKSALYILYVEPIRLTLTVIWYWVSIEFLTAKRDFVIRWLAISVTFQLAIATYLYLGLYDLVPLPDLLAFYLNIYKGRQAFWIGDAPLHRMPGTFDESPPFGLFMLSSLVIFGLWLMTPGNSRNQCRRWVRFGAGVSVAGAIASLSNQVLLAIAIFGGTWYALVRRKGTAKGVVHRLSEALLVVGLLLVAITFTYFTLVPKLYEATSYQAARTTDVAGAAGAERAFHLGYALGLLAEVPMAIWTGIGPGRYGDYAFRTGLFLPTVTIQNMPLSWLVEYGVFGAGLICSWLWNIFRSGWQAYGWLAAAASVALFLAAIFQANWLWEAWFLALAFLYSSGKNIEFLRLRSANPPVPVSQAPVF